MVGVARYCEKKSGDLARPNYQVSAVSKWSKISKQAGNSRNRTKYEYIIRVKFQFSFFAGRLLLRKSHGVKSI